MRRRFHANLVNLTNGRELIEDMDLIYKDEAYRIVGCCMEVYNTLGSGFLEAVYQEALEVEFKNVGIPYAREVPLTICYKGVTLKKSYFADFVCYGKIIIETKAIAAQSKEHAAQVVNYLKATGFQLGLLVNFGNGEGLQWNRFVNQRNVPQPSA